jgi:hypothetical protein
MWESPPEMHADRPLGVTALSLFFAAGALISGVSGIALAFPGSWLEPIWRLNPTAHAAFASIGLWAVVVMLGVMTACAAATAGLWTGRRWGHRLAVGLLAVNLLGDLGNAFVRGDRRTLIGLPIGGLLLGYLLSRRVRDRFRPLANPQMQPTNAGGPKPR